MDKKQQIKRISKVMRIVIWALAAIILGLVTSTYYFDINVTLTLMDGQFNQYYMQSDVPKQALLFSVIPVILIAISALYCLERLFARLQDEEFFGLHSVNYLIKLAWLNIANIVYAVLWSVIIPKLSESASIEPDINVDPAGLLGAALFIVIAYLLHMARDIDQENKEFI